MSEHNPDDDEEAITWWVETDSFDTARYTEQLMDGQGFDCGDQVGNGGVDSVYVYLYRKTDNTVE